MEHFYHNHNYHFHHLLWRVGYFCGSKFYNFRFVSIEQLRDSVFRHFSPKAPAIPFDSFFIVVLLSVIAISSLIPSSYICSVVLYFVPSVVLFICSLVNLQNSDPYKTIGKTLRHIRIILVKFAFGICLVLCVV